MKVSVLQENLAKGLSIVGRAVATKSTLPVLGNILLSTDKGRLKLSATNLEIGINCWVGAKVEDEGAITVPARLLSEYVSNLPNDRIDMELTLRTHTLNLACARVKTNIKGIDAEEFPLIPVVTDQPTLVISPDLLKEMIAQVAFAAATDESRPVLAGVLASFDGAAGTFTLAAADGFRLSVRAAALPNNASGKLDVIIPARTLQEVARILASIDTANDGAGGGHRDAQQEPGALPHERRGRGLAADRGPVPQLPADHAQVHQDQDPADHGRLPAQHAPRLHLRPRQRQRHPPRHDPRRRGGARPPDHQRHGGRDRRQRGGDGRHRGGRGRERGLQCPLPGRRAGRARAPPR